MIKAVIFDIDGVLLETFEGNFKFFSDILSKHGFPPPTREQLRKILHQTMMKSLKSLAPSATDKEIEDMWETGYRMPFPIELASIAPNCSETIKELSKKYSLGIVTSRVRDAIYNYPDLKKLQTYFGAEVAYEDVKNHKPHPEPLLLCAKKLNTKPEECVYIGDTEADLQAARASGMKIIIYSKEQFLQADASVSSFSDLPKVILQLN